MEDSTFWFFLVMSARSCGYVIVLLIMEMIAAACFIQQADSKKASVSFRTTTYTQNCFGPTKIEELILLEAWCTYFNWKMYKE